MCVHSGLSTTSGVILDHILGVTTGLYDYFIMLSDSMVKSIEKYVRVVRSWWSESYIIHENLTLLCSSRMTYHVVCPSRPYWRCLDMLMGLFHHFNRFQGQKRPKYVKVVRSLLMVLSQNITRMTEVWLLCDQFGLSTIVSRMFLDHIRGV